jgi:hypothetical protein
MKKPKVYEINVTKVEGVGALPPFLGVCVRHFQKSKPLVTSEKEATLVAPLDLLGMILPTVMMDPIDSLEIVFRSES